MLSPFALVALALCAIVVPIVTPQEMGKDSTGMQPPKPADAFFSGSVVQIAPDRISVSRSVMGRAPERRTFLITAATKVEGKIKEKSRVTVRYSVTEEGNVAVSILVRDHPSRPGKGKK